MAEGRVTEADEAELIKTYRSAEVIVVEPVTVRVAGTGVPLIDAARVSRAPLTVVGTVDQFDGVAGVKLTVPVILPTEVRFSRSTLPAVSDSNGLE